MMVFFLIMMSACDTYTISTAHKSDRETEVRRISRQLAEKLPQGIKISYMGCDQQYICDRHVGNLILQELQDKAKIIEIPTFDLIGIHRASMKQFFSGKAEAIPIEEIIRHYPSVEDTDAILFYMLSRHQVRMYLTIVVAYIQDGKTLRFAGHWEDTSLQVYAHSIEDEVALQAALRLKESEVLKNITEYALALQNDKGTFKQTLKTALSRVDSAIKFVPSAPVALRCALQTRGDLFLHPYEQLILSINVDNESKEILSDIFYSRKRFSWEAFVAYLVFALVAWGVISFSYYMIQPGIAYKKYFKAGSVIVSGVILIFYIIRVAYYG